MQQQAKIRYRAISLRNICDIVELKRPCEHSFEEKRGRRRQGLREGLLPYVAETILLFNEARRPTARETVLKCWIKSLCLPLVLQ